jgi:hypothetical protein
MGGPGRTVCHAANQTLQPALRSQKESKAQSAFISRNFRERARGEHELIEQPSDPMVQLDFFEV